MWKKWAKIRQSITFLIVTTEVHAKRTRFFFYSSVINKHSKLYIHSANVSESICFHLLLTTPSGQPSTCFAYLLTYLPHTVNCIRFCFALSLTFLFVYEISPEPLNRFAPNSQGRRVWSFARTSLKVKVNFCGLHAVYVWKNIFVLGIVVN